MIPAHTLTFPEVCASSTPVVTRDGYMIGGKDRKYMSDKERFSLWQKEIQWYFRNEHEAIPPHVMDDFQKTKGAKEAPMPKKFSWSYTALTDFESCPYAYAQKKVYKTVIQQETEATIWGTRCHEVAEKILKGQPVDDPEVVRLIERYTNLLKNLPGEHVVEAKYAVTKGWKTCDWWSGWGRGVIDFAAVHGDRAWLFDWKTGKVKDDPLQLKIFCLFLALHFPEVKHFQAKFIWLKEGQVTGLDLERSELLGVIKEVQDRVSRMATAWECENFPQRKNGLCGRWCDVLDCPHNGRGR